MEKEQIRELVQLMEQYHPYNDSPDEEECYCDSDYRRGYKTGYRRAWTTVMFALRTELRDSKYTVKQKRSKK